MTGRGRPIRRPAVETLVATDLELEESNGRMLCGECGDADETVLAPK